jgi:ADP-heptose:LPS heptosyltransferase
VSFPTHGPGLSATEQAAIGRICVLCWGLVGDTFIRVPIIEALRARFPRARIVVVVDPFSHKVLANHPACSQVIGVTRKKRPLGQYLRSTLAHGWRLRRERFDVSIDLYNGGSSPNAARVINARWRIAFARTNALRAANNLLVEHPSFCRHWTRELATLVQPLGIDPDTVRRGTSYFCRDESRAAAQRLLAGRENRKLIAINLGGGAPRKRWPVERFAALAEALQTGHGVVPVVYTNPGLEALTSEFAARFGGDMLRLPRLDFDIEAAVMERCHAVITGDSALMHLASGLKRPILGLFLDTRPEAVAPEDCAFVSCLVEKAGERDHCGRPVPDLALPVERALECYAELELAIARRK